MMINWFITKITGDPDRCLIALPGRGVPARMMSGLAEELSLDENLRICLEPEGFAWYPQPEGAEDQDNAVMGLKDSLAVLDTHVSNIKKLWKLENKQIVFVGYSAGSVMALQMAMQAEDPYAACIAIAGAVLEPEKVPKAQNQTPILLRHNMDDECFDWEERYLPMLKSLETNGYNVHKIERRWGGHGISQWDVDMIQNWYYETITF